VITVTYWETLIRLAAEVGRARKAGDQQALDAAQAKLTAYEQACLAADEMVLPMTRGGL
jgi:hypothetical protein